MTENGSCDCILSVTKLLLHTHACSGPEFMSKIAEFYNLEECGESRNPVGRARSGKNECNRFLLSGGI
jgi:hypothetical protein